MTELRAPDVIGADQAQQLLGIGRARFYQLANAPGFPPGAPARGTVYSRAHILAFKLQRELGQPVLEAVAAYEEHGTIAAAAGAAGVDPSTIRRWWRKVGIQLPTER